MDLNRLSQNAGAIISMFKSVFDTPQGLDIYKALAFASGLAGHACHMAVKANNEEFIVVGGEPASSKKFYLGEALNRYMYENEYSVLSFCNGFFEHCAKGEECPAIEDFVKKGVTVLYDDTYRIWGKLDPKDVYNEITGCWNGIYENMTAVYCESPEEWPVLFAIVLQNIMVLAMEVAPAKTLYEMALECAIYVSKMDNDSI